MSVSFGVSVSKIATPVPWSSTVFQTRTPPGCDLISFAKKSQIVVVNNLKFVNDIIRILNLVLIIGNFAEIQRKSFLNLSVTKDLGMVKSSPFVHVDMRNDVTLTLAFFKQKIYNVEMSELRGIN